MYVSVYMCVCICVCVYVCIYVCVYVCVRGLNVHIPVGYVISLLVLLCDYDVAL